MPSVPAPADPGRDEDPAWLDRDPMTAAEREAWLDRLCAPGRRPVRRPAGVLGPRIVRAAARAGRADRGRARRGRRGGRPMRCSRWTPRARGGGGRGRPARRGSFPGESASRAAGFGTGMAWDVTPGCAQLAVAADAAVDAAAGRVTAFGGVADHELVGLVCAFDRAEAHMAARKLVAIAEVFRRNPEDGFEPAPGQMPAVVHEFTREQLAYALGESRAAGGLAADGGVAPGHPARRHAGRAGRRDHHPGQGRADRPAHPVPGRRRSPGGGGEDPGPGRAADPRRAALRAGPRGDGGRAGEGEGAAGGGGADGPGGAVGRGLRQRRPDGPRTAAR